jgi:hypothetical protein
MRVRSLHRYPVKGLPGESLARVRLRPGEPIEEDRRFAFAVGRSKFDPAQPEWLPKRHFACLMLHARLARIETRWDAARSLLTLAEGERGESFDLSAPEGRQAAADWMTAFMEPEGEGRMTLAEAPGEAFADIRRKALHLVGLAAIEELGARLGRPVDPRRFRANVLIHGIPPFAEFDWVGREIRIGGAVLRVFDRTARCANTEVDPDTGLRDMQPQKLLREVHGHADMGVYAEVVAAGEVAAGDRVDLVSA